jgi:hypothetical protein
MNPALPSLLTADPGAGLALADALADQLIARAAEAEAKIERPGGMNFLISPGAPRAVVASVLFYAIAAANRGWAAAG